MASGVGTESAAQTLVSARAAIRHANEHDALLGKLLARIERDRSFADEGCSSAGHWAQMHGLDRARAATLLRAGRSFAVAPDTERAVLDGTMTPQVAGIIGEMVPHEPLLVSQGAQSGAAEDAARAADAAAEIAARTQKLFERAKNTSKTKLAREVREEKERIKQGERVVPLSFLMKERVRDTPDSRMRGSGRLARRIACRKAGQALSEGQAFEFVTGDFLARHDDDGLSGRKTTRARRMAPTSGRPAGSTRCGSSGGSGGSRDRTVPAEVRRRVFARAGGHCEFPGCSHGTFLEMCHIRAHSKGGDREEDNLLLLCATHHTMCDAQELDGGRISFFERIAATDAHPDGVAFVITATGELVEPDPRLSNAHPLPRDRRGGGAVEAAATTRRPRQVTSDVTGRRRARR